MGDPVLGCTMEDGGPRMGGEQGGMKNWGDQNDGGVVGRGTQFWDAQWKMGNTK